MTSKDPAKAAEIEARIRAAVAEGGDVPSFRPMIGDIMALFGAGRSTVQDWFVQGFRIGNKRMVLRFWLTAGGYRLAHPADVLAVLEETRKVRSLHDPDGDGGVCPTCGQELPSNP